jgi:hypothetical protein
MDNEQQIISKQRTRDHGEVFTAEREVNAMLDLVAAESERIDSRFLEPACGNGNFLAQILKRKLGIVTDRYAKSQTEYERYAVLAVSSLYGIDILSDNVKNCRERLFSIFNDFYQKTYRADIPSDVASSIRYILEKNIVWGDALTLLRVDIPDKFIVFSEWTAWNGTGLKRKDYEFRHITAAAELKQSRNGMESLFAVHDKSDTGEDYFSAKPIKEYNTTHYLRISDVE